MDEIYEQLNQIKRSTSMYMDAQNAHHAIRRLADVVERLAERVEAMEGR